MPSKKPSFLIHADKEILDKLKYIANYNERSATQETVFIIKQHIANFEKKYGEIKLDNKNTDNSNQTINNNGYMEIGIQNINN